jgi:hypothetical protein
MHDSFVRVWTSIGSDDSRLDWRATGTLNLRDVRIGTSNSTFVGHREPGLIQGAAPRMFRHVLRAANRARPSKIRGKAS